MEKNSKIEPGPGDHVNESLDRDWSQGPISSTLGRVIEKFKGRELVGVKKYGTTVDRNDLDLVSWARHAQEEAMDLVLYLERLIQERMDEDLTCLETDGFPDGSEEAPIMKGVDYAKFVGKPGDFTITSEEEGPIPNAPEDVHEKGYFQPPYETGSHEPMTVKEYDAMVARDSKAALEEIAKASRKKPITYEQYMDYRRSLWEISRLGG